MLTLTAAFKPSTMVRFLGSFPGDSLPTAKVSEKPRAVMVTDGSLGKRWESVSANNKENP